MCGYGEVMVCACARLSDWFVSNESHVYCTHPKCACITRANQCASASCLWYLHIFTMFLCAHALMVCAYTRLSDWFV